MARLRSTKVRLESMDAGQRKQVELAVAEMANVLKELVAAIRAFGVLPCIFVVVVVKPRECSAQ